MTLESLVRIVTEVVEQVMQRQRLKVGACVFDQENEKTVIEHMSGINDKGVIYRGAFPTELPDMLFIDCIPSRYMPKLALCLLDDEFTSFFGHVLLSGRKIVVINPTTVGNGAIQPLFESYRRMLESYGVCFLGYSENFIVTPKITDGISNADSINEFTGNVLSKKDVLENSKNGKIYVSKGVIITQLAKEEAELRKIEIVIKS